MKFLGFSLQSGCKLSFACASIGGAGDFLVFLRVIGNAVLYAEASLPSWLGGTHGIVY
jgi:hypothetical protein